MEDLIVTDNPGLKRFETNLGDDFAFVSYKSHDGHIILIHTYVPESHRGHGIAGRLIKKVLDLIKLRNVPVKVICPTITAYISIHLEYFSMVDDSTF